MRANYGKEMRELFAHCFLEMKSTSYSDILKLTETNIISLTETSAWKNADKQSLEQQRFEAMMDAIGNATNSVTKTIGNAVTAIIKTIAGR